MVKQVSEQVNRKCPVRNTMVQLSTTCADPECHDAQHDRQMTVSCQEPIILTGWKLKTALLPMM